MTIIITAAIFIVVLIRVITVIILHVIIITSTVELGEVPICQRMITVATIWESCHNHHHQVVILIIFLNHPDCHQCTEKTQYVSE